MAFIIVADSRSQEIERRELAGPMVIGRSPDCDLPVRDILLSRRHCMLEHIGDAWVVADLNSKNGTRVNSEQITRHILHDSDVIRIGRTRIAFRDGPFVPAPPETKRGRQRPADPLEATAGTLSGFRFNEEEEQKLDQRVLDHFPRPQPRPNDPRAYQSEHVQTMLQDIASSAWDTMLAEPERRIRNAPLPRPMVSRFEPVFETAGPAPMPTSQAKGKWSHLYHGSTAMLYIVLSLMLTGLGVWVISWGWQSP